MSVRSSVTITIACDGKPACPNTFEPAAEKVGEAKAEARDAGWYIGTGDVTYCPTHVAELGLRVKKRGAAGDAES